MGSQVGSLDLTSGWQGNSFQSPLVHREHGVLDEPKPAHLEHHEGEADTQM
jgi:hypothetical protein